MEQKKMQHSPYGRLAWMLLLSAAAMYGLMYAMVDIPGNVYNSFNQLYMTGLMVGVMLILEIALMGGMYPNNRLNVTLALAGLLLTAVCWGLVRHQVGVGDQQFLRSMIPHHGGAVLMCTQAKIEDEEIQALCAGIIRGQREEIARMRALLEKQKN